MDDALTQFKNVGEHGVIQQCLHGYSDGHRLLASSFALPDEVARIVNRLSDLSGAGRSKGFEEYVTGYPLSSISSYAFAYTWYAPEMPRPGCVWTHTLVIPNALFSKLTSLEKLLRVFQRPVLKAPDQYYKSPIQVDFEIAIDVAAPLKMEVDRSRMATLLDLFYSSWDSSVIVAANSSADCIGIAIALWSQQWPNLRSQMTFSTGSLASRTLSSRPFDLQFVPTNITREIIRESNLANRGVLLDPKRRPSPWAQIAAEDASKLEGDAFRTFLWRVADERSDRSSFQKFASLFPVAHDCRDEGSVDRLLTEIAVNFPLPNDGARLKAEIMRPGFLNVSPNQIGEGEILRSLASTQCHSSFDAVALNLAERGRNFLYDSPVEAHEFFHSLLSRRLSPLAECIVSGIISGFDSKRAKDLANDLPQLLPVLFAANPELATFPALWDVSRSRQRELFDALEDAHNVAPNIQGEIVSAMIESDVVFAASAVFDRWGERAVHAALDWAEAHEFKLDDRWLSAFAAHSEYVLTWPNAINPRSGETVAFLCCFLDPQSPSVHHFDATRWLKVVDDIQQRAGVKVMGVIYAFLMALGLKNASPCPTKLISATFSHLHELLERNQLSYDNWMLLEMYTPDLHWLRRWDKCERVRRGLIRSFVEFKWPAEALLTCVGSNRLLREVALSALEVDGGKKLIKELVRRIKEKDLEATPDQLNALQRRDK